MTPFECPRESDVLMMVSTGRWPDRAPAELRAHAEHCQVCHELGVAAAAMDELASAAPAAAVPSAGTVWWRAQLRARQEAARQVARPITAAQALAFAAAVGVVGAVFGATALWNQRGLSVMGRMVTQAVGAVPWTSLPQYLSAVPMTYWVLLLVVGLGLIAGAAVFSWAMKEE
jgi:hypothetical protein